MDQTYAGVISIGSKERRRAESICEEWNRRHPVGTVVEYYQLVRMVSRNPKTREFEGPPSIHRTRSKAFIAGSVEPVIYLEAKAGYVSLDHVKPRV